MFAFFVKQLSKCNAKGVHKIIISLKIYIKYCFEVILESQFTMEIREVNFHDTQDEILEIHF